LYDDTLEFDGHCGINLEIRNQWLYHGTDERQHSVIVIMTMIMIMIIIIINNDNNNNAFILHIVDKPQLLQVQANSKLPCRTALYS